MRNILAIIRKELYSFVLSPVLWVVLAVFLLIIGSMYFTMVQFFSESYSQYQARRAYMGPTDVKFNLNERVMSPLFGNMAVVMLLLLPVVSMRLLSEEQNSGTIELLLTRPVTVTQLVVGKYCSSLVVLLCMLLPTVLYPLLLMIYGTVDTGPLFAGYASIFLLGASFLALGLAASAVTPNQIVAAALGFGGNLLFWIVSWFAASLGSEQGVMAKVIQYLSVIAHFEDASKGVLNSADLVYYVTFIAFFLFVSHRLVDSMRWR